MKNYPKYFLLGASLLFIVACKDDKDGTVISTSKIKVGTMTVVTAVENDKSVETTTDFFQEDDIVNFQIQQNQSSSSVTTFYAERLSDSWDDLSDTLYYRDIYINGKDPAVFTAEFGSKELTTDQSTSAKFHAAHYLKGDAYVKSTNANLLVDSMLNQHVLVILRVIKSNNWPDSPAFETIVNANSVQIHTTGDNKIAPLYDGTQTNRAVYSAIIPSGMIPAAGSAIFTLNDETVTYSFASGGYAPGVGQTLVVTAIYNYGNMPSATAVTKDSWDVTGESKYGYSLVEQISTIDDLGAFAVSVSSGVDYTDKTVVLSKSLDLNGENIIPIGTQDWPFNGTFLGGHHTISNFVINNTNANSALFGSIGASGTIKELTVENVSVETNSSYASALAGSNYGYIISCLVSESTISGGNYIGGLTGYNDGTIVGSAVERSSINSMKKDRAIGGGIAGFNYRNVIACRSEENSVQVLTRSENKFGLLIGENSNVGNIDRCSWSGNENLPSVGYSIKMPENGNSNDMSQAIKDYNSDKKEGDIRYCNEAM